MYYPKSQIKTNLYTSGKEFVRQDNNEEYKGYYWQNSSNKFYTGKTPSDKPTVELFKDNFQTSISSTSVTLDEGPENIIPTSFWQTQYSPLTTVSPGKTPPTFITLPTEEDYKVGEFQRYFTKKRTQNVYFEISKNDYELLVEQNPNIQYQLYLPISLSWRLEGFKEEIYNTNRNTVYLTETRQSLPGFLEFFKGNFNKYDKNNLYTNI